MHSCQHRLQPVSLQLAARCYRELATLSWLCHYPQLPMSACISWWGHQTYACSWQTTVQQMQCWGGAAAGLWCCLQGGKLESTLEVLAVEPVQDGLCMHKIHFTCCTLCTMLGRRLT